MDTESEELTRTYYRSIDEDDYEDLSSILGPEFVQKRPDRTIEGRERFVRFMREERPVTDTRHAVDAMYGNDDEIAVRGRLLEDDTLLVRFVDVFEFGDGVITALQTFTR